MRLLLCFFEPRSRRVEPHPSASGAVLRLCEWRHTYCEVEKHLLASGDLLRVARKSDSLRFRWVYRIRRDRSHRVFRRLDTHALLARCFALIRLPGLETANRQIQGGSGPAVRRHYLLPGLHCLLIDMDVTGESLYVNAALSTIVQVKLFAPEAPL